MSSGVWWLSFANEDRNLGVCIVEAPDFAASIPVATTAGLNPGGEIWGAEIPDGADELDLPRHRMLAEDEIRRVGARKVSEVTSGEAEADALLSGGQQCDG